MLDDAAAKVLSQSLKTNNALKGLELAHNEITDFGCRFVAHIFAINEAIMYIEMEDNPLTEKGLKILASAPSATAPVSLIPKKDLTGRIRIAYN